VQFVTFNPLAGGCAGIDDSVVPLVSGEYPIVLEPGYTTVYASPVFSWGGLDVILFGACSPGGSNFFYLGLAAAASPTVPITVWDVDSQPVSLCPINGTNAPAGTVFPAIGSCGLVNYLTTVSS